MSNQTFIKKDRISFAINLIEQSVIAPNSNAIFIGPNSAITYDGNSNLISINTLQGISLSNQYIYADGTHLSNIPTSAGQTAITSSIIGLGTFGYISSSQLISTVTGLGDIYISSAGAGQTAITSSIIGLGTFRYISSSQLISTVTGLGDIYISSAGAGQTAITSTIIGLGTFGYISSSQLTSTVRTLGTLGYISSSQLTSTITGWSGIPANKNLNMGNNNISNVAVLYADVINPNTLSIVNFPIGGIGVQNIYAEPVGQVIYINDAVQFQSNAQFNTGIDLSFNNISNVNNIYFTEAIGNEIIIDYINPNDFVDVKILGPLNLCNNNISNVNTLYYNEISGNQVIANSLTLIDTINNYTTTFSNYEYGAIFDTNSSQYGFTNSGGTETAVIQVEYAGFGAGFLYVDNTGAFHLSNNGANKVVIDNNLATDYIYSNSNSVVQFTNNSIDLNNNSISNINMLEFNDADIFDFGTIILSNGYFSYTSVLSPYTYIPIASDWWQFAPIGAINMNNNEISNVQQTSNINSAATNTVISQSFSGVIDNTSFGIGSFSQLIVSFPVVLQFMNPNNFFTNVWQTTFTFNGALVHVDTNYAFYFSLSNIIQGVETTGINFNSNTPYCITGNFVNPFNISASYTDSFDLSSWGFGDSYCVLLYFQGLTIITNNFNSGSYTSFLQPSIQYFL